MKPITFHTPPDWPQPPAGFLPPPSWRPDPAWPPAPAEWQFYRDGYGFPTPAPAECWQPTGLPVQRTVTETMPTEHHGTVAPQVAVRTRRTPWLTILAALLALALVLGGGALLWSRYGTPGAPGPVDDVTKLYNPPLQVGAGAYQLAGEAQAGQDSFQGDSACVTQANAAVKATKQTVVAGTDRGWGAMTWRFADAATAQGAFEKLSQTLQGCKDKDYTYTNPVKQDQWVQFDQTAANGDAHGKVVLSTDSNTVTWLEGGREDMGETAFKAIRKRLRDI